MKALLPYLALFSMLLHMAKMSFSFIFHSTGKFNVDSIFDQGFFFNIVTPYAKREKKTHLNIEQSLLLTLTAGIKPGPPVQQACEASIAPFPLDNDQSS